MKEFDDELSELDSHCIALWESQKIMGLEESIINYLDEIIGQDAVSYFIYETNFGKNRTKENSPYFIAFDNKEYSITDFDSWYEYLLATEETE